MRVWRRSSRCDGGQCVAVAAGESGQVLVRDSKDPDGPVLDLNSTQWRFVLDWIRAGDLPVGVAAGPDGVLWYGLDGTGRRVHLEFTHSEWKAFTEGARAGEFDRFQVSIGDASEARPHHVSAPPCDCCPRESGDPQGAAVVQEGADAA